MSAVHIEPPLTARSSRAVWSPARAAPIVRDDIAARQTSTPQASGGLVGLGGAEFRFPLLIAAFRFGALQAVILNKAMSLVVVASALPFRAAATQTSLSVKPSCRARRINLSRAASSPSYRRNLPLFSHRAFGSNPTRS